MELAFAEKAFRDLCLNEALAVEALGPRLASSLKRRLADLAAVHVASETFGLPGQPRELERCDTGTIAIRLADRYQLLFTSGHRETRILTNGSIDWSTVRRIKILGMEKYHD